MVSYHKIMNSEKKLPKVKTYLDKIKRNMPNFPCRLVVKPKDDFISCRIIKELQKGRHQLIIKPVELSSQLHVFYHVLKEDEVEVLSLNGEMRREGEWDIALYTSGSTGRPKLYGYTNLQIEKTLSWYKDIYNIDSDSTIISTLPLSYNFTFVAGFTLSNFYNINYLNYSNYTFLKNGLKLLSSQRKKIILLANPIILNEISENYQHLMGNILIDSGGAPLSKSALHWFRTKGIDVREGYGLTETCSLTHFDSEGNEVSAGTVGREMLGVETSLIMKDQKPYIQIDSPNFGCELDDRGQTINKNYGKKLITSDLGFIDNEGRLSILGRSSDHNINGFWPRQILDLISPILGPRCALVLTPSKEEVFIKTWDLITGPERIEISSLLGQKLNIDFNNIQYLTSSQTCHSYKLDRILNVSAG